MLLAANKIELGNALKDTGFASVGKFEIPTLITTMGNLILIFAAVAAFFYLLWGCFDWITSSGEKEALDKAKKKITNAILGLAIILSIFAIIILVGSVFGDIDLLKLRIPTL